MKRALLVIALLLPGWAGETSEITDTLTPLAVEMRVPVAVIGFQMGTGAPTWHLLRGDLTQALPAEVERHPERCHFRLGSVSKLIVGALVLRLVEKGVLDLDATIASHGIAVPGGERIRLRHLGNHTSGLPDAIRDAEFQKDIVREPGRIWLAPEILEAAFRQKPMGEPGERHVYSNTNTILLALAAEQATGTELATLLREQVLEPLGLHHTGWDATGQLPTPSLRAYRHGKPGHWLGYGKEWTEVTQANASWTHAAGNLYGTPANLLRMVRPLAGGMWLDVASRREQQTWVATKRERERYGFCLEQWGPWQGHRGDVPGYQVWMGYCPEADASLVVLCNLSNTPDGEGPANALAKRFVEMRGLPPLP